MAGGFYGMMLVITGTISMGQAEPATLPEPNPPVITLEAPDAPKSKSSAIKAVPTTEWTYHKTADNLHPDDNEQAMVWMMNHARGNPSEEGVWLATMDDTNVAYARTYFSVNLTILMDEFDAIDATPPAAFDVRLYNAAKAHSDDLISRDAQDHTGQFDRVTAAGFSLTAWGGNVYSYTKSAVHGHAGFNIDWGGDDGTGMQTGRGHRKNIMAMDYTFTNVGIAVVPESDGSTQVGPLVTTQNFAIANTGTADHYNVFIVGTVWEDANDNDRYDAGEGLSDITIIPDQGGYYAVSSDSGGYALPVNSGTYQVTFSGDSLDSDITKSVIVSGKSVLLDLVYGSDSSSGGTSSGSTSSGTTTSTDEGGGGCFIGTL
jgi:hypothetical protein